MKKLMLVGLVMSSVGCGTIYAPNPMQEGNIAIVADAKGMNAFFDGVNGSIAEGKASPDIKGSFFGHREKQEQQYTVRETQPGLLGGLFAPKQKNY